MKFNQENIQLQETRLLNAIKTSDVAALDDLLHPDLLFNLPNGVTISKADDLTTYRSGGMNIENILPSDLHINIIGDTAVVAVTLGLQGRYFERVLDGKFRYLRVWKLEDGVIRVIAGSCIPLN